MNGLEERIAAVHRRETNDVVSLDCLIARTEVVLEGLRIRRAELAAPEDSAWICPSCRKSNLPTAQNCYQCQCDRRITSPDNCAECKKRLAKQLGTKN